MFSRLGTEFDSIDDLLEPWETPPLLRPQLLITATFLFKRALRRS